MAVSRYNEISGLNRRFRDKVNFQYNEFQIIFFWGCASTSLYRELPGLGVPRGVQEHKLTGTTQQRYHCNAPFAYIHMQKVFCEYNFWVGLHTGFDVLKTCEGGARRHTNKPVFIYYTTTIYYL
jgi:hypothetical protein